MTFMGYRRAGGRVGVRSHVLVFPTVICAAGVAQMISKAVPGTVCVTHSHGCGHLGAEKDHMVRTMAGFCANPNVAGILLVGLGCELITTDVLGDLLANSKQRVEALNIQQSGGTTGAVAKGIELARKLIHEASLAQREPVPMGELTVGLHCGASDTMSGLTANPSVGVACDMLIRQGGTAVLTETPEMLGAEHILKRRAASDDVRVRLEEITRATEQRLNSAGVDIRGSEPSPGNIAGGLTTLEEKSLGAIRKGGTSPITEVVDYAQQPGRRGLVMMDGPAHDVASITGLIAAGAQIILFTTGRGTPVGAPIAPVIKISSNCGTCLRMQDNVDINAGTILDSDETIETIGQRIFETTVAVASGELTRAEILGHSEFAIHSIGPTV